MHAANTRRLLGLERCFTLPQKDSAAQIQKSTGQMWLIMDRRSSSISLRSVRDMEIFVSSAERSAGHGKVELFIEERSCPSKEFGIVCERAPL